MVFVAAVSLAIAVVLAVLLVRSRAGEQELTDRLDAVVGERDRALTESAASAERASLAADERDDALERVQRSRRDATEVANRLQDEVAARAEADEARRSAEADRDRTSAEVVELRTALDARGAELAALRSELDARPAAGGPSGDPALLWSLALERVERLWRTSIAVQAGERSPIERAEEPLRAALEVLADATHEESGADITIRWEGDSPVPAARAVLALAVVESVVAGLAKADERIEITVRPSADGVELVVAGDPGATAALAVPDALVAGDGRYLVA